MSDFHRQSEFETIVNPVYSCEILVFFFNIINNCQCQNEVKNHTVPP
jgi:hypothetical protein